PSVLRLPVDDRRAPWPDGHPQRASPFGGSFEMPPGQPGSWPPARFEAFLWIFGIPFPALGAFLKWPLFLPSGRQVSIGIVPGIARLSEAPSRALVPLPRFGFEFLPTGQIASSCGLQKLASRFRSSFEKLPLASPARKEKVFDVLGCL